MIIIKKNIVILTSGPLAQLVEQFPFKEWVAGSNPARLTILIKFCTRNYSLTINKINQEPFSYVKSRLLAFLASHGKFAFDFVYPNPSGWMKYYGFIKNAYQDKNIKLLRQILVFSLNMIIYAVMIYFIFFSNYNLNFKLSIFFIGLAYLYLFSVSFLFSCCEQERMLFTGYIKEVLFIIFLVKKYFKAV